MANEGDATTRPHGLVWRGAFWLYFVVIGQAVLLALSFNENDATLAWAHKVFNCPTGQVSFRFHSQQVCREDVLDTGETTDGCQSYDDAIDEASDAGDRELEEFLKDAQREFGAGAAIAIAAYVACYCFLGSISLSGLIIKCTKLAITPFRVLVVKVVLGILTVLITLFAVLSGFTGKEALEDAAPFVGVCADPVVFPGFLVCAGCIAGAMSLGVVPLLLDLTFWNAPVEDLLEKEMEDANLA